MKPADLDRLLHSAAKAPEEPAPEAPFGFETRVLARWRSRHEGFNDVADLTRFLRRTGAIAFAVVILAGAAAYRQFTENVAFTAPQTNEYAIADSQIQTEFSE
ncbi:MAG: hypothetical protein V7609_1838 [Verrucomicrobiota bacterium]